MDAEAATVFDMAVGSMGAILSALNDWASTMLEDSERDEAIFHINEVAKTFDRFVLAIADHEGIELWNIKLPGTESGRPFTLQEIPNLPS